MQFNPPIRIGKSNYSYSSCSTFIKSPRPPGPNDEYYGNVPKYTTTLDQSTEVPESNRRKDCPNILRILCSMLVDGTLINSRSTVVYVEVGDRKYRVINAG